MNYTIQETRIYYDPDTKKYGECVFGLAVISAMVSSVPETVCKVICTKHGDIVVIWKNLYFEGKPDVEEKIERAKIRLLEEYDETKTTTYVAYLKAHAVRDVEYDIGYMSELTDPESWVPYPDARIFIGLFHGDDEDQAKDLAASFAQTDVQNVEVLPVSSRI